MEPVQLEFMQVLYEPGQRMDHVYFPNSGVLSYLAVLEDGSSAEVATVGDEGMVGIRALLGVDAIATAAKVIVQVPGAALRLASTHLNAAASRRDSVLVRILHRYLHAFLSQATQSVACNTLHPLGKRLARWLLMTHDRVHADQFPLTHELLALMLGVRRASVTEVARRLQTAGLIRYIHGKMTILDRIGLEAAACECYRIVKKEYDDLLR